MDDGPDNCADAGLVAPNPGAVAFCRSFAFWVGCIVATIGCVGFAGWVFDSDVLKSALTGSVTMKANAAICLIFEGAALPLLLLGRPRRLPLVLALAAALLGTLTLAEHVTGVDLRIDQLLFTEPAGALATASPGRMGPPASTSYLLLGIALALLHSRRDAARLLAQSLGLAVVALAMVPLIGYAYGFHELYGVAKFTGIAANTAIALALLAAGVVVAYPDTGLMAVVTADDAGGVMARRLLIPSVVIPFLLGWIRTLGERAGVLDLATGRPVLIIGLILSLSAVVWWSAASVSAMWRHRARAEADRERMLLSEQAARAQAERASRAKDEFLAVLSHELRTPLNPVLLTVSLIESRTDLPDGLLADLASIRRNVELESRLIGDLLDLTRIERGKFLLERHVVDVHALVRSAVDICLRDGAARLNLDLSATRHHAHADPTRLQQVFWNLVNNAIKFVGDGGTITVRSTDAAPDVLRVEVSDTGAGIAPDVLPRLFNAFEQGDVRATRQQAGLGLGLAISRKLVEAHGGTIRAASDGPGRGATFTIELPTAPAPVLTYPPPDSGPQSDARPPLLPALSILLVEDHESTLAVMSRILKSLGHSVTGVTTVTAALAAASNSRFDVIVSDLGLPDGTGLDLMRQIRHQYAGRAIALTGYGMDSDVAASLDAGFADHLTKPIDLQRLRNAIERVSRPDRRPAPAHSPTEVAP